MTPDPNADSNRNGHSNDERHDDNQPLEPRLYDAKLGSVFTSQPLVIAVGFRERSPVECLWRCVSYNLKGQSVRFLPRTTSHSPEAPLDQGQRSSHRDPVLEL